MVAVVRTCRGLRELVSAAKRANRKIGVVPTMGALHAGHVSLAERSCRECDFTIVTIFVNPTQFAAHEDLSKYPRTFEADLAKLAPLPIDVVFAPPNEEMYPPGFSTYVDPPAVAKPLEGAFRPEHFRGVTTVVLKLFNVSGANAAYFGQKDFQQAAVIQAMTIDLNAPVEIVVCPIIREPDGLAMSSRNVYLSRHERQQALALSRGLRHAEEKIAAGETSAAAVRAVIEQELQQANITEIDYIAIADPRTLQPQDPLQAPTLLALAVRVGATRLIDNLVTKSTS